MQQSWERVLFLAHLSTKHHWVKGIEVCNQMKGHTLFKGEMI